MKNCIKKCLLFIGGCIIPLHAAAKPGYSPSTQHKIGVGATYVLPFNIISSLLAEKEEETDIETPYKLHLTSSYSLLSFKKSFLSLEGNVTWSPITIGNKSLGLRIAEQHIRFCPAIAFTTVNNDGIYTLVTNWLGYEWDFITGSQLTKNGLIDTNWPSTAIMGNIIWGTRCEFFYGIYIDANVCFPITEFIDSMDKIKKYKKNNPAASEEKIKQDVFLYTARCSSASWIDIGLGVNILSLLYPPQQK